MPIATYGITLSTGGVSIQKTGSRQGDGLITREVSLPAAKAGTLTTRTDDDTGIVTSNGHGILDTDTVAVFWNGGRRYGVDVTAVDANTISINAGAGNNLPVVSTPVTIVKQVAINVGIDGDAIKVLGLSFEFLTQTITDDGHVTFKDAAADVIAEIDLEANTPQIYDVAGGQANPFTGDPIANAYAFNGCATEAATLKIISLEDSTP
ncbi:MAG TPA: hypothetical protein VJ809_00990 [Pirellulales bacterium]|nr:hypothetical protein [Pirellulales bacterium]